MESNANQFEITQDQAHAIAILQQQRQRIMEELVRANRAMVAIVAALSPYKRPIENFDLAQKDGKWIIQVSSTDRPQAED